MSPAIDKRGVVNAFRNQKVEHGERQRIVRAWPNLQPDLRFLGEFGATRIDDNDFWLVGERLMDVEARFAVGPGVDGIVAPEQHAPRRRVAGEVADRKIAQGENAGVHPWVEALGEARFAPVRRSQGMSETRHPPDVVAAGPGAERNRFRSELVSNGQQARADLVKRFVPTDPLPLSRPARPLSPHGILETIRVVDEINR
jgi:hypothetical protein